MKRKQGPARSGPTVGQQAEINAIATALAQQWFARNWFLRSQFPDVFADYALEHIDAGEPSGQFALIQQKAHRTLSFSPAGFASQVFEKKQLRYYAEKSDFPVFLLLIDVTARTGYYLFVQEWLDQAQLDLAGEGTRSLRVPEVNRIDDVPAFLVAFRRSRIYLREKRPGSVEAALRAETARVAKIDPRFNVTLDVVGGQKLFQLHAKEELSVTMKVTGEENVKLFQELFEYGRHLTVTGDGIEIQGLPLFDELKKSSGKPEFVFGSGPVKVDWHLWTEGDGEQLHLVIDGGFTAGKSGLLFTGQLPGGPMAVEIKFPPANSPNAGTSAAHFTWDFKCWRDRYVDDLPYFEDLAQLARLYEAGRELKFVFQHAGRKFFRGSMNANAASVSFSSFELAFIQIAREAAAKAGVRPRLPVLSKLTAHEVNEVRVVRDLLVDGVHRKNGRGLSLTSMLATVEDPAVLLAHLTEGKPRNYRQTHEEMKRTIFDTAVELGPVTLTLAPAKLVATEEVKAALAAGKTDSVQLRIVGVEGSTLTIERTPPAD